MEQNSKTSVLEKLQRLYFHDSQIRLVELRFSDERGGRSCRLHIDYYDWEGNETRRKQNPAVAWEWKSLVIDFCYVAVFEYSAPDFLNRAHEINEVEFGSRLEELKLKERGKLKEFPGYRSPLIDGNGEPVSIKFNTQNSDENSEGYFLVIGSDVKIGWGGCAPLVGQIHIPIKAE